MKRNEMGYGNAVRCTRRAAASRRFQHLCLAVQSLTLLLIALASFATGNAHADVAGAISAFNNGHRESALAELHQLAEAGDNHARYTLGVIYAQGPGVAPDHGQALKWFREAANDGYSSAQYSLGMMHARGIGVSRDPVRGLMWLSLALQDREADAGFRLQVVSMAALLKKEMTPEQIAEARVLAEAWKPER